MIATFEVAGHQVDVYDEGDHLSFVLHVRGGSVCFGARDLAELEVHAREALEAHREVVAENVSRALTSRGGSQARRTRPLAVPCSRSLRRRNEGAVDPGLMRSARLPRALTDPPGPEPGLVMPSCA